VTRRSILAAVALAAAVVAGPAAAQSRGYRSSAASGGGTELFSVWGVLDPGPVDGVGLGARVMFPLVPEGVIRHARIHDEFTLELGADFVHYNDRVGVPGYWVDYDWNGVLPVVGGTWNFWFTPHFALYPKLDVGYWIGWYSGWNSNYGYVRQDYGGFFVEGALGLIYRFQTVALRAELGSGLLRLGLGFSF